MKIKEMLYVLWQKVNNTATLFYPVGSCYETKNSSFIPEESFGGSWSKLPKKSVIKAHRSPVTMSPGTTTQMATITIPASSEYLILAQAGTGVGSDNQKSNCGLELVSGDGALECYTVNSNTASSGAAENCTGYIKTATTACVIAVTKYNYSTTTITTGTGKIIGIPLKDFDDGTITWIRTN